MTNASRQKSYRHHRGSAHRKIDSEHSPKRQPGLRQQAREASGCSQLLAADIAALREDLSRIQGHVKELGTDKSKDTEDIHELSKVALTKIASACYTLSAESIQDVDLMSKVVFSLFSRDLIKVPVSSSPQQDTIELLCQFFISAYKYEQSKENVDADSNLSGTGTITSPSPVDDPDRVKVDILRALSAVLFENGFRLKNSLEDLLEIIVAVGKDTRRQEQSELRRMALNCMANLVCKTGHLLSTYHEQMYELLLANLTITSQFDPSSASGVSSTSRRRDRGSDRKLISSALRALHFLLQEDKRMSTRSLAPFINIVCRFMFYTSENLTMQSTSVSSSTSVFNAGVIQRSVYSSPSTNMVSLVKSAGVGSSNISPSQQHSLDISEPSSFISYRNMQSSDSEYSDSELGAHLSHRRQHDGKVRLNALLCLQALARGAPKQLQPHWPKFLTSSNAAPMMAGTHKAPSLIGLISTDPIFNVRSAACAVLGSILENSKQYLAMAEEERNTAGLSGLAIRNQTGLLALSERIGIMVRELHIGIATAMNALDKLVVEHGVIIPMIKCCSSIVANCSYEKMRPGLALLVWRSIERFMDSNDCDAFFPLGSVEQFVCNSRHTAAYSVILNSITQCQCQYQCYSGATLKTFMLG
ncbi:hypothetical protein BCR41DRAFT_13819 [Lobosporangium transversale]|uniref:DUF4042 domain-containing protein n=1 Tax=Lobosporangium transversale TaxID=64571 RepID=A0A1Y2GUT3_9FUNG|nr:hypothetical protein BCR41DRAFT_13819 [Lobosporangium transversale]ORZ22732.1 hypothetical protein BCR41DRAFT_13819 [Lobosporangium transversale]|eukprot:XP_021883286.1 hypothetical protein BCR41DRAFT_13819 [Lobosporangium transversale]